MPKLFLSIVIFSLISCSTKKNRDSNEVPESEAFKNYIKQRCIKDRFAEGHDLNVYGSECINNQKIIIKTLGKGELISTSQVSENITGLNLEGEIDFKNKFYNTPYYIKKGEGDDKQYPFLLNFLPEDEEFTGQLNTNYHIIFKTMGNYLFLFKASKNINALPYIERTSLKVLRNNNIRDYNSFDEQKEDYYMVPFIGYPIKYCSAKNLTNSQGEKTYESTCEESLLQDTEYIKINPNNKQNYNYLTELKKDLFRSDYFKGEWYFAKGAIETSSREAEMAPTKAYLVTMEKEQNALRLKDRSGDVEDRNRRNLGKIPVKWLDFEMNQKGNNQFISFGEKTNDYNDSIKRPYLRIEFNKMENSFEQIELIELTLSPDYFSYIQKVTIGDQTIKRKTSFLRSTAVHTRGFHPRRWFIDDHKNVFGILMVNPQDEGKRGEVTEGELLDHFRMIRFNTDLKTEEEKKTNTKLIKWYFSKNSTKDSDYREVAQKAVDIYNQAFKYITKNSNKKIEIKLVREKGEYIEKDLGDLRYNILNLVKPKDLSGGSSGLLGAAPSYVNPDTGQIIGTTSNIFIHTQEVIFDQMVRDYIRYEAFQKEINTESANEIHVVSPFLRSKIKQKCPQVTHFIEYVKNNQTIFKPRTELNDREIIISCGKELTKIALLGIILHEMGHSFGLAHNFKGSIDHENFYHSEDEIKEIFDIDTIEDIANFSSVMDYGDIENPHMMVLGKYDLAALRYLYLDEIELKDGSMAYLYPEIKPKNQQPLTADILQNKKHYSHCSDIQKNDTPLCYLSDYGKNPEEIATNDILNLKRMLNNLYRYDLDESLFKQIHFSPQGNMFNQGPQPAVPKLGTRIVNGLARTILLYRNWEKLKNNYLDSIYKANKFDYIFNNEGSIIDYQDTIKKGLKNNKEYALYYPIRDILFNITMDLMSVEEMKCHIKDTEGKEHVLSLETIKNLLRYKHRDSFYIENCYSPIILSFFEEENLTLIKQTGYPNFISYYPKTNLEEKVDVVPIDALFLPLPKYSFITNKGGQNNLLIIPQFIVPWFKEPDKLKMLTEKAKNNVLNFETNNKPFDNLKNSILINTAFFSLNTILEDNDKKPILSEHLNDMRAIKYEKGTGADSFYKRVIEPLDKGLISINNIEVPFLTEVYKQYEEDNSEENLLDYLTNREDTLDNVSEKFIIIPLKKDSFAYKLIKKYNETIKKLEELENKSNLSTLEKLNKDMIENYSKTLYSYIIFSTNIWE